MKQKLLFLIAIFTFTFNSGVFGQLSCALNSQTGINFIDNTFATISPSIACNQGLAYMTYTPAFTYNGVGTATGSAGPCLRLLTSLTPANAVTTMSLALYEGSTYNGCMSIPSQTPVPCFASIPNTLAFQLYNTNINPTQTHSFVLCHMASQASNITYTVTSCYDNIPITNGTWTLTTAAGCQTVGIPANTPCGVSNFTVAPPIPSFVDFGDGTAGFNPATTTPGVYTATYSFVVLGTCTTVATRTFVVTNPYNPSWTSVSPLCSNASCVALNPQVTGTSGGTWTGAGVSSNSFCPSSVGAGTSTVTYSVGITATCGSANTKTITVIQTPVPSAGPNRTLTCLVTSTTLAGSGGTTYTWTGPGAFNSNLQNPTVTVPGTYTLFVTNAGCTSSVGITVVVSQVTVAPVATVINGSITCTSAGMATLGVNPSTGMSYTWTGSGIVSGSNTANPVVNSVGTYTLNYTDLSTGCSSVTVGSVGFNTVAPSGNATTSGSINCVNTTATISHSDPTYNYTWTAPATGTILSGTNSQSASVVGTGVFTVFVTTPGGCPGSYTTSVTGDKTLPSVTVTPSTTLNLGCSGPTSTINLTASSTPSTGLNYNWSNGSTALGINVTTAGLYTVMVTNPANSCTAAAQYSVTKAQDPAGVNAGADNLLPCDTATVYNLFGSSSLATGTYSWTGPGIKSGANSATVSIITPGVYVVTVTDPNSGCFASDTVLVGVSSIVASFTADPTSGNSPLLVNFTNGSVGATSYTWTFGNGIVMGGVNPSTTYTAGGTYTVILNAQSGYCFASDTAIIVVNDKLDIKIPNVFTPNGDGVNDVFNLICTGCKEVTLEIYNRWGNLLYVFTGPKAFWDGVGNNGSIVPAGTYFYIAKASGIDGSNIEQHGTISVFR